MIWDHARGWPAGGPRVLLTDCWLQNAGDAAIAIATQRMVEQLAPGAVVVHAAYGRAAVGHHYPDLRLAPPLDALLGTRWAEPAAGDREAGRAFVADADLVISQGGGFLREGYSPWARVDSLARAVDLTGSVALLGQTVGVFRTAFGRRLLGAGVLSRASVVLVRDAGSRASAVELGADPARVHLGTDFSLELVGADLGAGPTAPPADPGTVGVVLSDHVVPGESADRGLLAARFLAAVLERSGDRPVTAWSSSQGVPGDSDDDVVARTAVERLPAHQRDRVTVPAGHLDAYDLYRWSAAFGSLVSMRFHPALLAAAQGIPSVLAMSDPKVAFFDGSPLRARVVTGHDAASARHAAGLVLPTPGRADPRDLLGPVADRLAVNRRVVADLLAGLG
ncbi:polysaccharide pyruvyl transferase family protein [Cellulomonas aerilata]|uniref:Polysaccharide pyruvyl transferase domain-containing protein n=1 Tax=Cellulomonas aerilata TaxID=515326 RepID=A0A512DH46_9CELL|nr:polysaccharide pyruvyl transferase family protein [Cellulomonas aerilata]GEO35803.1 hypothetical protein CAE01nite_35280 [Cellulomonas aerilata]